MNLKKIVSIPGIVFCSFCFISSAFANTAPNIKLNFKKPKAVPGYVDFYNYTYNIPANEENFTIYVYDYNGNYYGQTSSGVNTVVSIQLPSDDVGQGRPSWLVIQNADNTGETYVIGAASTQDVYAYNTQVSLPYNQGILNSISFYTY